MRQRLQFILAITAIVSSSIAFVLDATSFGQMESIDWKALSATRLLFILGIISAAGLFLGLFLFLRQHYKKRISITIPIAFIIFSLGDILYCSYFYYGLDEEYNYFTAKRDIRRRKIQILEVGLILTPPNFDWDKQQAAEQITEKRFGYKSVYLGCDLTHGIEVYNDVMEDYLEEVNGKGWRIKENRMLDSIMNSHP